MGGKYYDVALNFSSYSHLLKLNYRKKWSKNMLSNRNKVTNKYFSVFKNAITI